MKYQGASGRTKTGARRRPHSDKAKHELGHDPTETQVGDVQLQVVDSRGGTQKVRALSTDVATVTDGDGESQHVDIEGVVENEANPNYARRNILTKGAIIDTDAGNARVTSRPGQGGQINAVLVE